MTLTLWQIYLLVGSILISGKMLSASYRGRVASRLREDSADGWPIELSLLFAALAVAISVVIWPVFAVMWLRDLLR